MISFFAKQKKAKFAKIWQPLIHKAKTQLLLENELPHIKKRDVWLFIEEWNVQYEQSNAEEKTGLAVLAYRLNIHRYAAAMLINGKSNIRLSGVVLLGHMGDESAWPLLKSLINDNQQKIAQAAFTALKQINSGRVVREAESTVNTSTNASVDRDINQQLNIKT